MGEIRRFIPVGFKKHVSPCSNSDIPFVDDLDFHLKGERLIDFGDVFIYEREMNNARKSLGTLGGGNHFIEFQKNELGELCIMIHSGSRNLGKKICDYYNAKAVEMNEKYFSQVPKQNQLAFLPLDDNLGQRYLHEMRYALEFAYSNRRVMTNLIIDMVSASKPRIEKDYHRRVDVHHNYAVLENHFGKNVMVHRKGATRARTGDIGLIPGSQGSSSYVVSGLGNKDSFCSCSHGAGRKMSRTKAKKELDLALEQAKLDDLGVVHGIRSVNDLDEAAGAYKDIDTVMENQKDLVNIIHKLTPVGVIKG